jgi:hypothetical protein
MPPILARLARPDDREGRSLQNLYAPLDEEPMGWAAQLKQGLRKPGVSARNESYAVVGQRFRQSTCAFDGLLAYVAPVIAAGTIDAGSEPPEKLDRIVLVVDRNCVGESRVCRCHGDQCLEADALDRGKRQECELVRIIARKLSIRLLAQRCDPKHSCRPCF